MMTNNAPGLPSKDEYAEWYAGYVALVPDADILAALAAQPDDLDTLLGDLTETSSTFRYAAGKWSIRQLVGHLIDGERVFALRALCFSRGETAALPGFDENSYVASSAYADVPLEELRLEFRTLRAANVMMFGRLGTEAWNRRGTASGYSVSVRALAYIMVGHPRHHMKVIGERYLPPLDITARRLVWMKGV
ncbi:MAG: DinB family protein [Thermoanaerobaculia bacterium]|nr:DinB family protein [Thermoanaerobaculia bacterium]